MSDAYISSHISPCERGFTLVELSIVVAIVAVLVGGTLMLGGARLDQQRVNGTKERLNLIERALKNYAEINGRLPCPADSRLTRADTDYGQASAPYGDCVSGATSSPHSSGEVVSGAIPFIELALPADLMFDNWGRKFTYVVDRRYTASNAARMNAQNSKCGSIVVADAVDTDITSNAMFILLSHGRDGHGAYHNATVAPWQLNAQIIHNAALDNAGLDTDFNDDFDNRFRLMGYYEDATDAKNTYDDIMIYRNRSDWQLASDAVFDNYTLNNIPTRPGWVYVPEYILPSSKVVPGFEVMKYEASDADGDGIPHSVPAVVPEYPVTFTEARLACQKLGGYEPNAITGEGTLMEYDVVSETQWLSIAHQSLSDSRNWVGSCFDDSALIMGHSNNNPANALAPSDNDQDGYFGTPYSDSDATLAERAQRRTTFLPSGAVLWDLSGNLNELTYCDLEYDDYSLCTGNGLTTAAAYTNSQIGSTGAKEYNTDFVLDGFVDDLIPLYEYDSSIFTGNLHVNAVTGTSYAPSRSSSWAAGTSGMFRVQIELNDSTGRGFRCAHNLTAREFSPRNLANLDIWYDASDLDGDFSNEWDDTNITEDGRQTATLPCNGTTNICVSAWRNKAKNDQYHARSKYLNGAVSGNENNMPTIKLNAINGRPAVNFGASVEQWLDTHHGVVSGSDDGNGYNFDGKSEFSIFVVANASSYDAIVAATDNNSSWWPYFVLFPYNIGNHLAYENYVFLISSLMAGDDSGNSYCLLAQGNAPADCLPNASTVHYACAKMGGIDTVTNGLTHGSAHIATGIFQKNVANGLAAYVDGGAVDNQDGAVQPDGNNIHSNDAACGGGSEAVNMLLAIGMNRNDPNIRTIGDVAEIIIYNRALSNKERVAVERYLAEKYDISYQGPGSESDD